MKSVRNLLKDRDLMLFTYLVMYLIQINFPLLVLKSYTVMVLVLDPQKKINKKYYKRITSCCSICFTGYTIKFNFGTYMQGFR